MSCLGKIFTSILNKRLSLFLEMNELLNENQAGFRESYSTIDHIFNLNLIANYFVSNGKKLYCAFIDYEKALDTVWRKGLWLKMVNHGISGKCLNIIKNMYNQTKSALELNGKLSDVFDCNIGVRQGENLSPLLFAMFLNDMDSCFAEEGNEGIEFSLIEGQKFRLLSLLYAYDTVVFADSADELQKSLDALYNYSSMWKLKVNVDKTKIMIFSKSGRSSKNEKFSYNNIPLDIVNEFKYLGVIFKSNGRFLSAIKHIKSQANKAMRCIISRARSINMPIDLQMKLFDSLVIPILTYGAEVWGLEKTDLMDELELQFYKLILNV